MKRFLSTELHNKDLNEDAIFLSTSNNNKKKENGFLFFNLINYF